MFGNFFFLGFVVFMFCFIVWNVCVKELGVVKSINYIYIVFLVIFFILVVIINEKIIWIVFIGCFFILCGVYLVEWKINFIFEVKF